MLSTHQQDGPSSRVTATTYPRLPSCQQCRHRKVKVGRTILTCCGHQNVLKLADSVIIDDQNAARASNTVLCAISLTLLLDKPSLGSIGTWQELRSWEANFFYIGTLATWRRRKRISQSYFGRLDRTSSNSMQTYLWQIKYLQKRPRRRL